MIPRIAGRGYSFKGAGLYYLHDKEASTHERVSWTQVRNMPVSDPEAAMNWMAYTSINANKIKQEAGIKLTGRKRERGTVYTFSLSWSPEENPDRERMIKAADETLEVLGLQDHQTVLVAHNDTDHSHVHIITNLVNPNDGRVHDPDWGSKFKLSDWALEYEQQDDSKLYCHQRLENKQERDLGKVTRYQEPRHHLKEKVQDLYNSSDSGRAFSAALQEQGFSLAKGNRRRFVLVDDKGKVYSLSRQLNKDQRKDHLQKLSDLKNKDLPLAKTLVEERQQQSRLDKTNDNKESNKKTEKPPLSMETIFRDNAKDKEPEIFDRDAYETEWQQNIVDEAIQVDREKLEQYSENHKNKPTNKDVTENYDTSHLQKLDQEMAWSKKEHRKRVDFEEQMERLYQLKAMVKQLEQFDEQIENKSGLWDIFRGKKKELEQYRDNLEKELAHVDQVISGYRVKLEREIEEAKTAHFKDLEQSKDYNKELQYNHNQDSKVRNQAHNENRNFTLDR